MTMRSKATILYGWLVRTFLFFLPEIPLCQRLRGRLYAFGMKSCGRRFKVSANVVLNRLELLSVGNDVYFAAGCFIAGGGEVQIGSEVLFGPHVNISAERHVFNGRSFLGGYEFGKIVIEDGCWIGGNSSILMGTRIPKSSVVGAGSVCNKVYEQPNSLIAGVPAKIIKSLV